MLTPILWLKDYTNIPEDIKRFTEMMTLTGTNVEDYEYRGGCINNIVTAKVTEIYPHPDSDHMLVCKVDDGSAVYNIVTGAQNVKEGAIVPLARNNAVVAGNKKIKTSKLRGVKSEGMLCSAIELGISSSIAPKHAENGIYILPEDTKIGEDIKNVLGLDDYVVDFELTNNRQDCNSILGIAYEAAATLGSKFTFPEYEYSTDGEEINKYLTVEVKNYELCRRYTARMVKIKKIQPSPLWMQTRLMSAGVRPINNVVDVSNFVMIETGQPLHTFDYKKLEGGKIIVENAYAGDEMVTLDGIKRELNESVLMINDAKKHIAIAGIMGGLNSDIDDDTEMVVIESANFNKNTVRKSSKFFGLRTESSAHFEKGISIHLTKYAADRAASLMVEIGAAEYIDGIIDVYEEIDKPKELSIDIDWFNKFIGIDITPEEAAHLLERLDFNPIIKENMIFVTVPKFRQDIEIREDLAEELIRMYGYNNIPLTMAESSAYISAENKEYAAIQKIKSILIAAGGNELLTYSFISPAANGNMGFSQEDPRSNPMTLINPLGLDNSVMRTTLICGLMDALSLNYNKKNKPALLFEIANVYIPKQDKKELPNQLSKLCLGKYSCDFFELKAITNYVFEMVKLDGISYIRSKEPHLHPGRSADIISNEQKIGYIGQIHPNLASKYDICEDVCVAELDVDVLVDSLINIKIESKPLAKYPSSERDLALVADIDVLSDTIKAVILKHGGEHLRHCEAFDVYINDSIGKNKKSIAFNLLFRSDNETLTDDKVDKQISDILQALKEELDIDLR